MAVKSTNYHISTIDISSLTNSSAASSDIIKPLCKAWHEAFSQYGFAIITGHGCNTDCIHNLYDKTMEFFRLPHEIKMKYCLNQGYGKDGYVPQGMESVARSRGQEMNSKPDPVESLCFSVDNLKNLSDYIPEPHVPGIRDALDYYFSEFTKLLNILMEISAQALNLPRDYFEKSYTNPSLALRLAYYRSPGKTSEHNTTQQLAYGAHTDYLGLTILRTDDYKRIGSHSLEVQYGDQWLPVVSGEDALIINSGDLIERWTNNKWKSGLHRVLSTPAAEERVSIVFFTGPEDNTVVVPLPGTYNNESDKLYKPILSGDHLKQKLEMTSIVADT